MNEQNFVSSNWIQRPSMVTLTHIPLDGYTENQPCIVDPSTIVLAYVGSVKPRNTSGEPVGEDVHCTIVVTPYGHLSVTESPEEVLNIRNEALFVYQTQKPGPRAV